MTTQAQRRESTSLQAAARWFEPRGRGLGMWAFALNRITGILLYLYLFLHFTVITNLAHGPAAWNDLIGFLKTPPLLAFDVALILVLLYHGLNGLRLTVLALNIGTYQQKAMFWGLMVVGAVVLVYSAVRIFTS